MKLRFQRCEMLQEFEASRCELQVDKGLPFILTRLHLVSVSPWQIYLIENNSLLRDCALSHIKLEEQSIHQSQPRDTRQSSCVISRHLLHLLDKVFPIFRKPIICINILTIVYEELLDVLSVVGSAGQILILDANSIPSHGELIFGI